MQSSYFIGFFFVKGLTEYLFNVSINKSSSANLQGFLLLQLLPSMMMMMVWLVVFFVAFDVYIIFVVAVVCEHVLHHWLSIACRCWWYRWCWFHYLGVVFAVVHFISKVKHIKMRCHCVQIVFPIFIIFLLLLFFRRNLSIVSSIAAATAAIQFCSFIINFVCTQFLWCRSNGFVLVCECLCLMYDPKCLLWIT